jgi:hypothetical protein
MLHANILHYIQLYKSILRRIVRLRQYLINWYFDDIFIKNSKKLLIDITTDLFEDYINTKKLICILFYFHHRNRNHSIKIVQQPWKTYVNICALFTVTYRYIYTKLRPFPIFLLYQSVHISSYCECQQNANSNLFLVKCWPHCHNRIQNGLNYN